MYIHDDFTVMWIIRETALHSASKRYDQIRVLYLPNSSVQLKYPHLAFNWMVYIQPSLNKMSTAFACPTNLYLQNYYSKTHASIIFKHEIP